jgi:hypothetical protein
MNAFLEPALLKMPWNNPGELIPQAIFHQAVLGAGAPRIEIVHTFAQPEFCFMLQTVRVRSAIVDPVTGTQFDPVLFEIAHSSTGRTLQNAGGESQDRTIPGSATTWQAGTYPGETWYNYSDGSNLFYDMNIDELFLPSDGVIFRLSLNTNSFAAGTNPVQIMATGVLFRGGVL